jgi:hypothetical protein
MVHNTERPSDGCIRKAQTGARFAKGAGVELPDELEAAWRDYRTVVELQFSEPDEIITAETVGSGNITAVQATRETCEPLELDLDAAGEAIQPFELDWREAPGFIASALTRGKEARDRAAELLGYRLTAAAQRLGDIVIKQAEVVFDQILAEAAELAPALEGSRWTRSSCTGRFPTAGICPGPSCSSVTAEA